MPEKTQAEIPYSLLEYTAEFKGPILEGMSVPARIIAAVLDALQPSGYNLDGVEANTQVRKLSEYSIIFNRTTPARPSRSLTLGLGKVHIAAENLDWSDSVQFISEQDAALGAIRTVSGAEFVSQKVVVGMHIQLKEKERKDVTAPLLSSVAFRLLEGDADSSGVILMGGKTVIVIDNSLALANGLFVRISQDHQGEASLAEIAERLRRDEQRMFDVLGLEGAL